MDKSKQQMALDLNSRERVRYAHMLNSLADQAKSAAKHLLAGDDLRFTMDMLILSLKGKMVDEILGVIHENVTGGKDGDSGTEETTDQEPGAEAQAESSGPQVVETPVARTEFVQQGGGGSSEGV